MIPTTTPQTETVQPFETFFQGWLIRQEHYLEELLQETQRINSHDEAEEEEDGRRLKDLINRVISHYNQYYQAKSRVADDDVFLLFSQTWLTPFERTFLWISGFRPGLAFQLVSSTVLDLSAEQSERMERLREETMAEERVLAEMLATIQRGVVAPPMLALVRREVNGLEESECAEQLRTSMETLVECADYLRGKTVMKVMEILNSAQSVKFLAAAAQFHLGIRARGLRRETDAANRSAGAGL